MYGVVCMVVVGGFVSWGVGRGVCISINVL